MFKTIKKAGAALLLGVAAISSASAAPILVVQDDKLMGASHVLVDGAYYDVKFVDDIFASAYPDGLTSMPFYTAAWAWAASRALLDDVLTGIYDTQPSLTYGCSLPDGLSNNRCSILTPYWFDAPSGYLETVGAINDPSEPGDLLIGYLLSSYTNFASDDAAVLAVWSSTPAATDPTDVPEPTTTAMLGLGLMALLTGRQMGLKLSPLLFS